MPVQVPGIPTTLVTGAAALLAVACAGSAKSTPDTNKLPERLTLATLSGPLCKDNTCRCREPGEDAGLPAQPGLKRYEVRMGPAENELWVKIDDMLLYKSVERANECYYVDLAVGKHPVKLRAHHANGFAARLEIAELGKLGSYRTFEFACGSPGPCGIDLMHEWQASLARYRRGLQDPCGSTRIRDVAWRSGETPDRVHPEDLELDLVLDIYTFAPQHESGHPECRDRF